MKRNLLKSAAIVAAATLTLGANAQALQEPAKDSFNYEPVNGYTLTNDWIYSAPTENFVAANLGDGTVRGMAAKDGKMYFPLRGELGEHKIIVVDGATGKVEKTIALDKDVFTTIQFAGTDSAKTVSAGLLPNNDIQFDQAGNCLVGNCTTNNAPFQIYKVDLTTGKCTKVIDEVLAETPDFAESAIRFDSFGVYGDVDGDAVIMAANSNPGELNVFRWTITEGKASKGEAIWVADPVGNGSVASFSYSSRVFPIEGGMFYVDGFTTLPTLYDEAGALVQNFFEKKTGEDGAEFFAQVPAAAGMNYGHNGLCEFTMTNAAGEEEYFLCMAATNTAGTKEIAKASTYALIKYKDINRTFADAERLFIFPDAGFGGASNPYRTSPVFAEVNGSSADLYVYVGQNGFAKYTFGSETASTDVENVEVSNVITVNNKTIELSENADVVVYALTGQVVANAANVNAINVVENGIYIVKAINENGTQVSKVIVK